MWLIFDLKELNVSSFVKFLTKFLVQYKYYKNELAK